jgi:hypothetical protein
VQFDEKATCLSPGFGNAIGTWPKGFKAEGTSWTRNCHESFKLTAGSKAQILAKGQGTANCNYSTNGKCTKSGTNDVVAVPRGALCAPSPLRRLAEAHSHFVFSPPNPTELTLSVCPAAVSLAALLGRLSRRPSPRRPSTRPLVVLCSLPVRPPHFAHCMCARWWQ